MCCVFWIYLDGERLCGKIGVLRKAPSSRLMHVIASVIASFQLNGRVCSLSTALHRFTIAPSLSLGCISLIVYCSYLPSDAPHRFTVTLCTFWGHISPNNKLVPLIRLKLGISSSLLAVSSCRPFQLILVFRDAGQSRYCRRA